MRLFVFYCLLIAPAIVCAIPSLAATPQRGSSSALISATESDARAAPKLTCVSVEPTTEDFGPSCDELCGAEHAACVAVQTGPRPAATCASPTTANSMVCRCCRVE